MIYDEFIKNLHSRGMFRIHPSLDRIQQVLRVLGDPQDQYPTIHIAGTNGKGSVAAALESVLRASGYRTGLYTSPHLVDLRERVQVNGRPTLEGFTQTADEVFQAEQLAKAPLTYFELLTAMAFWTFAKRKVDIGIIECGLGGRWDATNVIRRPILSLITSIGLDHTDWLGSDEYHIAVQKAGIIKPGGLVVSGVRGEGRQAVVKAAHENGAVLDQIDSDFKSEPISSSWRSGRQVLRFLSRGEPSQTILFGLLGSHQLDNAALVLAALRRIKQMGWTIPVPMRDRGLREVSWPGRLQMFHHPKAASILLDGAHNPSAIKQLLRSIGSSPFKNSPKTFVFSAFHDKDIRSMGRMISPFASEICLCRLSGTRGTSLQALRSAFPQVRGPIRSCKTPQEALTNALSDTPKDGLVVITGSLALVGDILRGMKQKRCSTLSRGEIAHA